MIKSLTYRHLIVSITLLVVFVLVGIVIWQHQAITLKIDRQQEKVSEIVSNVVREQAKKDLLLPKIVFINVDSSAKKEIDKQLTEQIANILTTRYLADDTTKFQDINLKPFFVFPKANEQGNYVLSDVQLNELKNHIEFLAKQVDLEVDRAKEEVGKDIDRLNMWVSIWIGVIGFLGIFIPLIINIDTAESAKRAIEKSNEAEIKSNEAIGKIDAGQSKIDKIEGIETNLSEAKRKIEDIVLKTSIAEKSANDALDKSNETENILKVISAIGNLKDIDINTLQHISKPNELVTQTLYSIHSRLSKCKNQYDRTVVKDCIRQLGVKLFLLSLFKFMKREHTALINAFLNSISYKLYNSFDEIKFDELLIELKTLADNLKTENENANP